MKRAFAKYASAALSLSAFVFVSIFKSAIGDAEVPKELKK